MRRINLVVKDEEWEMIKDANILREDSTLTKTVLFLLRTGYQSFKEDKTATIRNLLAEQNKKWQDVRDDLDIIMGKINIPKVEEK